MRRRGVLGAVATGMAVGLPGCGVFTYNDGDGETPTKADAAAEASAAEESVTRIFSRLASVSLVEDGSIMVSASTFDRLDFETLHAELEAARRSVDEVQSNDSASAAREARVEFGVELAHAWLTLYDRLRVLVAHRQAFRDRVAGRNYAAAESSVSSALDAAGEVETAAGRIVGLVETGPDGGDGSVSVPSEYHTAAARRDARGFTQFQQRVRPAFQALSSWAAGFTEAIAAQQFLNEESWASAEAGFIAAIDAISTAQTEANEVSSPPPVFTTPYQELLCGLDVLEEAFAAARDAARAARQGDGQRAEELLSEYDSTFSEYESRCR